MEDKGYSEETNIHQAVSFAQTGLIPTPTYITLPISLPGAKLDDSQTIQIQVLNPNLLQQNNYYQQKLQLGQIHFPIPSYNTNTTVLTVAYNNEENKILCQNGFTEDMTVLAAIQPQDLQTSEILGQPKIVLEENAGATKHKGRQKIKQKLQLDHAQQHCSVTNAPMSIKTEYDETSLNKLFDEQKSGEIKLIETPSKAIKKKITQKKIKKPALVNIATALDGTTLFCCPECQMAYSNKSCLEKHLLVHKIERRFICDICGAGLKRKEHLERHKLGHNPERPFTCTICEKGFKRKEHLNLHIVIHSGNKTEICGECGKGFYRKDHLRKHVKSHITKRIKEQTVDMSYSDMTIDANGLISHHFSTLDKMATTSESIIIKKE